MDNQILSGILAGYEVRRQQNQMEEVRRQSEIAGRFPAIGELIARRHEMVLRSVRGAFGAGSPPDPEKEMRNYNERIAAALVENGYPADYLAPVCQCPLCGDTGYVYERSIQKPCACLEEAYRRSMLLAGPNARGEETFAAFDESRFPDAILPDIGKSQREYMRFIKTKCEAFAANVPAGPLKLLLLHGGSGLGKTFLLNCVGADARARGVETLAVTAYDLLMDLKNAYFSRGGDSAQGYFDAPLLLIDDLGMEPLMENITVEQIYHLLNARLTRGLYTVISTNLSRAEIKQRYTERVSSRLLDPRTALAIPFLGKDIRLIRG